MPGFTFDIPPDFEHTQLMEQERQKAALLERVMSLQASAKREQEEEARRAARPKSMVVTLRMTTDQLEALDGIAAEAGASRGFLLRQLAADFINYTRENGIDYRGCLLGFRHNLKRPM